MGTVPYIYVGLNSIVCIYNIRYWNNTRFRWAVRHSYELFGLEPKTLEVKTSWAPLSSSVANPGCLSIIPDPDFYPSRIQQQNEKRRGKNFVVLPFFVATNIIKL
jgi:hypothetical protein